MTETKIFPPVVNGTPILKLSQEPHPSLPPPCPWSLWTGGRASSHLSLMITLGSRSHVSRYEIIFFIFRCRFFGRSCLLEHVTIPVARRGDHYPEEEPDCCVWILKKTFGGGEHLQMLMKMGLELLLWSGNRWTIKCLIHDAACSKPTFWDPVILLL